MRQLLSASVLSAAALVAAATASTANAELIYGMTAANSFSSSGGLNLVTFDSATPGAQTNIGAFSGLGAGQTVRSMDFRPATGQLYAVGATSVGAAQLYTVDITTAVLTPVGAGFAAGNQLLSIDFNPTVDRIRIVTRTGGNFRVNPNTGAIAATDTNLAYAAGDPQTGAPNTIGIAYSNNVVGGGPTTLYAWDYNSDVLFTIGSVGGSPTSPNTGLASTVFLPSGFRTFSAGLGMDISGLSTSAYVTHDDPANGLSMSLFSIDLATGAETLLGAYATGTFVNDIAVPIVPAPGAAALLGLAGLAGLRRRRN